MEKEIRQFREREVQLKNQLTMVENLKQSAVQRETEKHEKLQFQLARSAEIKEQLNKLKADSKLAGEDLEREISARNELESKFETLETDYGTLLSNHKRLQSQFGKFYFSLNFALIKKLPVRCPLKLLKI